MKAQINRKYIVNLGNADDFVLNLDYPFAGKLNFKVVKDKVGCVVEILVEGVEYL